MCIRDRYNAYLEMLDKMEETEYGNLSEIAENQQRSKSRTAYEILGISQEKCDEDVYKRQDTRCRG